MQPSNLKADVGDIAVQQRRFEQQEYDAKGVVVVASAWLLFYGLAFAAFAFKQGVEVFAYLY